jgi:hypothetical protein
MRAFFRGWPRKTGCVVLVLAIAVAIAWARAFVRYDVVYFSLGHRQYQIISTEAGVALTSWDYSHPATQWRILDAAQFDDGGTGLLLSYVESDFDGLNVSHSELPHWQLLLPLTLISAFLILWKPRKKDVR